MIMILNNKFVVIKLQNVGIAQCSAKKCRLIK